MSMPVVFYISIINNVPTEYVFVFNVSTGKLNQILDKQLILRLCYEDKDNWLSGGVLSLDSENISALIFKQYVELLNNEEVILNYS